MPVRLGSIELNNFKNVQYGKIKMPSLINRTQTEENADIVGIYGQNGSGKTAVVEALTFLKTLMTGNPLPVNIADYITKNINDATLLYSFYVIHSGKEYTVEYLVSLDGNCPKEIITREKLSVYEVTDGRKKCVDSMDFNSDYKDCVFRPKKRWSDLASGSKQTRIDIEVEKRLCLRERRSVIFSPEIRSIIYSDTALVCMAISELRNFAYHGLFVVKSEYHLRNDYMEFVLPPEPQSDAASKSYMISLSEPTIISSADYPRFSTILSSMNTVMHAIIPGFLLKVHEFGNEITKDGTEGIRIELMSERNSMLVPIRYESEGIKKILTILNLLIAMYNNYSMCIVVDELDAGVFEFLLGELLSCIEESGKGQLIFTSHNLRPLEMINHDALIFTTTNPSNRYIRIRERSGNLRSSYLRHISLGGLSENIYEPTNTFEIAGALRKCRRDMQNG